MPHNARAHDSDETVFHCTRRAPVKDRRTRQRPMTEESSQRDLRANLHFAEKDRALREDVHRLGALVGELVREQGGEALFDLVESARRASIAHREGDKHAVRALTGTLAELSPPTARDFIRAFSTWFQMVNMAEKVHRIRRRRDYLIDSSTPQPFGFIDTLQRLREAGANLAEIETRLGEVSLEPVFTAPRTQATRRTLLAKQQRIARHLVGMLDPYLTPHELGALLGQLRTEMTTGWQTEERPAERRLGDDAEHVLFFITEVLYRMIPPFYESLETALATIYGDSARTVRLPELLRFSTSVGGDMDGDPNVTAKSIRESMARHRALVLNLYYNECRALARQLSQSESRVGVTSELRARSEQYAGHFAHAAHAVPTRHRDMPYRVLLRLMQERLQATHEDAAFPYESSQEFGEDIELIADSLRAGHGRHAGLFAVNRLARRVRTFGFHMATLDIRQHALVHRRVVAEGLDEPGWLDRTPEKRTARLKEALVRRETPLGSLSAEARKTLGVFQAIAHCRRKYGERAIGPYIVRMTHGPDDVLSVVLLARWGRLGLKGAPVPLDIVPLFETEEDLRNAATIMAGLLEDERYRHHVKARGDHQMIMIEHSDGSDYGGIVSACWTLDEAQRALVETLKRFGVRLTFLHGHGCAINRGGRGFDAVLAAPTGAVAGRLRMAEHGETINTDYGLRGIALRSLEQKLSAVLSVTARPPAPHPDEQRWQSAMSEIAAASRAVYRELVHGTPEFETYFLNATPIDLLQRLGVGARSPAVGDSRPQSVDVATLEFAWAQNRCLMPAWFGFASGVERGMELFGRDALVAMYRDWHFFGFLVSSIEMALAKADLEIAERYSRLAGDLHERFFPVIRDEYERCVASVLQLNSQQTLLEKSGTLRRAIRLRNPYVDPMSLLQVDLLERWRSAGRNDDAVLEALQASVNGIAHGMQDTG